MYYSNCRTEKTTGVVHTKNVEKRETERFFDYLLESGKSELTAKKYLHDVSCFAEFLGGREITQKTLTEYKACLHDKYAVSSANSMLASLNSFLRFCGRGDCVMKRFRVQKRVFCPESKQLSKDEYFRLCKAAERKNNHRLSLIMQTLCSTGIRISELEYVTVEAVESSEATVSCKNKTRTVFIVRELRKKLLAYCRKAGIEKGCVFVTKTGKPMCRSNIWRELKALCADANVSSEKVFPHNFRHLFARIFYRAEKDIAKLADILGHSSIDTTRIYLVSTGTEHRKKIEKLRLII